MKKFVVDFCFVCFLCNYSKWTTTYFSRTSLREFDSSSFLPVIIHITHPLICFCLSQFLTYPQSLCFFANVRQPELHRLSLIWNIRDKSCRDATCSSSRLIYFSFLSLRSLCSQEVCQTGVRWVMNFYFVCQKFIFHFSAQPLPVMFVP